MRKGGRSMDSRPDSRRISGTSIVCSDVTLGYIFAHLDRPADRSAVSRVCKQWKRVDSSTRKHVQIANCYSISPGALSARFPNLLSLKIKGKSRAFDFDLLPPNWGGHAGPWVAEVARAYAHKFESLWLRRMQVTDADLLLLARFCHDSLLTLKLEKCSGFSAVGLACITANCRSLKVLYLEESTVLESVSSSEWLRELAIKNSNLEELNFQYTTGLDEINVEDLETIAANCKSLRSLKVCEVDVLDMERVTSRAASLRELGAGCCARIGDPNSSPPNMNFPRSVVSLSGLYELTDFAVPIISSMLPNLIKLDLQYSLLTQEGHCQILRHCHNLEVLLARTGLGDAGLITVANVCKKLRRIRLDDSEGEGLLSPAGIIPIAENCVKLEFIVMYVADINNATMKALGKHCTQLRDCRFVLLPTLRDLPDLPLDEGVKSLLQGCGLMKRFALYVRHGALTDTGMAYIGDYGAKLKWVLLGCTGESDVGITRLASGCHSLERLEMRDCPFTEVGLTAAAVAMQNSLKFFWIQGRDVTHAGGRMLSRALSSWIVETAPTMIIAYASLSEPRRDEPPEICLLRGGDEGPVHDNGAVLTYR